MCFQGYHLVDFFHSSSPLTPHTTRDKLPCDAFHWWVQLVLADADLDLVLESCFACGDPGHLVQDYSLMHPHNHICALLNDPHGGFFKLLLPISCRPDFLLAWDYHPIESQLLPRQLLLGGLNWVGIISSGAHPLPQGLILQLWSPQP